MLRAEFALALMLLLALASTVCGQLEFRRGDLNNDDEISLTDLSYLMTYLFHDGSAPACLDRADSNDDGRIDIADVTTLMSTVLNGEDELPEPFLLEGADPTLDLLPCGPGPAGEVLGSEIDHVFFSFTFEGGTGPAISPGQSPAIIGVGLDAQESLRGFTVVVEYDPAVLDSLTCDFSRGVAADYDAELRVSTTTVVDVVGVPTAYTTGHVLLEALPPFATASFPPGENYHLADLVIEVSPSASVGTQTTLRFGSSPSLAGGQNELIAAEHQALAPLTSDVTIPVVATTDLFVRGDVNGDQAVDLGDVIALLAALLSGGEEPACQDIMDVDDTGNIDLADPIRLLELLFGGDPSLAVPYPLPGVDATPDGLDCL